MWIISVIIGVGGDRPRHDRKSRGVAPGGGVRQFNAEGRLQRRTEPGYPCNRRVAFHIWGIGAARAGRTPGKRDTRASALTATRTRHDSECQYSGHPMPSSDTLADLMNQIRTWLDARKRELVRA